MGDTRAPSCFRIYKNSAAKVSGASAHWRADRHPWWRRVVPVNDRCLAYVDRDEERDASQACDRSYLGNGHFRRLCRRHRHIYRCAGLVAFGARLVAAVAPPAPGSLSLLLAAWWLWWRLPKRQVDRLRLTIRDPKARADVEDNFRKTIGQLLVGVLVLIGAGAGATVAYLQLSSQQQASRELLVSNQVSKGFEQLGSDKPVVRLGGIYALEGVMNTSEQYHQPVLEALCAFVRDNTRNEKGEGPPTTQIQAALTVIGRRNPIGTEKRPDLAKRIFRKLS